MNKQNIFYVIATLALVVAVGVAIRGGVDEGALVSRISDQVVAEIEAKLGGTTNYDSLSLGEQLGVVATSTVGGSISQSGVISGGISTKVVTGSCSGTAGTSTAFVLENPFVTTAASTSVTFGEVNITTGSANAFRFIVATSTQTGFATATKPLQPIIDVRLNGTTTASIFSGQNGTTTANARGTVTNDAMFGKATTSPQGRVVMGSNENIIGYIEYLTLLGDGTVDMRSAPACNYKFEFKG